MPPRPRPPQRTPRSVVWRRRLVALGVLVAAFAVAWFAVASVGGNDKSKPPPPTVIAAPKPFRIVFPEGFTRRQMAARVTVVAKIAQRERGKRVRLKEQAYLAATARPRRQPGFGAKAYPLEGFLFPATYDFTEDTTSRELVRDQLEAFDRAWSDVDLKYAQSKNLTAYDVLIIASMVEKEVLVPKERPLVAAVIYNRLHAGMPLGIDATIRYGFDIPPTQAILQSQLDSDSPYNTRCATCTGLPPTPIANPGLAAIQAAAHPAKVDYLFFVRKPDCKHHFFTASQAEFDAYPRGGLQC